jgi:hypothetical protein
MKLQEMDSPVVFCLAGNCTRLVFVGIFFPRGRSGILMPDIYVMMLSEYIYAYNFPN